MPLNKNIHYCFFPQNISFFANNILEKYAFIRTVVISKDYLTRNQRVKTMADTLMYIPKDDTQNYPFCRLKLMVETYEHSTLCIKQSKFTQVSKNIKPTNKKIFIIKLWRLV